jgi:hypothetical protein
MAGLHARPGAAGVVVAGTAHHDHDLLLRLLPGTLLRLAGRLRSKQSSNECRRVVVTVAVEALHSGVR